MLRRLLQFSAPAAIALLACGGGVAFAQPGEAAAVEEEKSGPTMPSGPMLQSPIKAQSAGMAVVPEPVLTSILAASAVIFLRRGRR